VFGLSRRRVVLVCTVLLLAIVAGALSIGGAPPLATFAVSTVALAGLAWLVSMATESVGEHFGPAVTGVLQSTLGNLPELFVVFFALKAGELVVAQTSILGSLFANALLVLGAVIVVGARRSPDRVMRFQARLPKDTTTLLMMAIFIIALLGLAVSTGDRAAKHEVAISAFGAVALIIVYVTWLVRYLHDERASRAQTSQAEAPAAVAVDQPSGADEPSATVATEYGTVLTMPVAISLLAVAGVGAALVSDWFIGALDPAIHTLHLSKAFAGLVIVAIAGNAVENVAGIVLASKGRSDLAISVVKNSVGQVAVFLFPALVLLSLFLTTHLVLQVTPIYLGALVLTALALWQITGDGEAYAFEGLTLIFMYAILAVFAYFE
jgi:Ca2+:H+ antiporter